LQGSASSASAARGGRSIIDPEIADGELVAPHADEDLIRRMQQDDLGAFEAFFARHRGPVFRIAVGLTGDHQLAEEILQETFTRAHQHRASLRVDVSPMPWLHRVALNLCYDALGRRRPSVTPFDVTAHDVIRDPAAGPSETAEREELSRIVRDGVAALPEKYASVLVLYYLQRMSLQEVADTLDIQLGTVKSRVHHGLRRLRAVLEGDHRFGGAWSPVEEERAEVQA
jgi:RNA polymerase sigma-70 factor (ECF subfamily)